MKDENKAFDGSKKKNFFWFSQYLLCGILKVNLRHFSSYYNDQLLSVITTSQTSNPNQIRMFSKTYVTNDSFDSPGDDLCFDANRIIT